MGSRCGVSRKGAFSKNLIGEMEDTRIVESGSRIRIPGYGDEVHTGTEVEFTEANCGQINQKNYSVALSEYEICGFRKLQTEKKSSLGVWNLVDQMSIMLLKRIMCSHQSLRS